MAGRIGVTARSRRLRSATVGIGLTLSMTVAACGGSGSEDDASSGTADVAAAKATIEPYVDQPSKFPVTEPLEKSPKGKRIAYMQCDTPICALFHELGKPAAEALGMELVSIDTGQAADSVAVAFDSAVAGGFDGVWVPGIPSALWQRGLDELNAAGVPVVSGGVVGGDPEKIAVMQVSDVAVKRAAGLLAADLVARHGPEVRAVLYTTPELPFTSILAEELHRRIDELCDGCQVRDATVPAATLGNRAPALIVDDLQAHADTETIVFTVGEQANGLAAALKTAGLTPEILAFSPTPDTLQQIKNGDITAGLGLDLAVQAWTSIDSLARLTTGQDPDPGAVADIPPMQFLTADNLPDDVSRGWVAYPDYAQRFTDLWKSAA